MLAGRVYGFILVIETEKITLLLPARNRFYMMRYIKTKVYEIMARNFYLNQILYSCEHNREKVSKSPSFSGNSKFKTYHCLDYVDFSIYLKEI